MLARNMRGKTERHGKYQSREKGKEAVRETGNLLPVKTSRAYSQNSLDQGWRNSQKIKTICHDALTLGVGSAFACTVNM